MVKFQFFLHNSKRIPFPTHSCLVWYSFCTIIIIIHAFVSRVSMSFSVDETLLPTKAWTPINKLLIMWKSDLTDKMKRSFFQAAVVSILLYGFTTWMLTKQLEEKLDSNYTKCCEQYWTSPGGNTPQSTNYRATYLPSQKLSKLEEPDMQDTAGEAGTSS